MTIRDPGGLAAAMLLVLAGCTPPPSPPVPIPAATTAAFDGTYSGTIHVTGLGSGMNPAWCETDPIMHVNVVGGDFTYAMPHPNAPGNPTPVYSAKIGPNAALSATISTGVMTGHVTEGHMVGTIDGSACIYSFYLVRQ